MKKRLLTVVMLASALCLFTACGSSDEDVRGEIVSEAEVVEDTVVDDVEESVVEVEEVNPEAEAELAEALEIETAEVTLGTVAENVYENAFIGIGCQFDSNWVFKTDEEILELNQFSKDLVGDEYKQLLENAPVIQDMMATTADQSSNVNIAIEKLEGVNALITEQKYAELSTPNLEGALESMGLNIEYSEISTVEFAGKEHTCIDIAGSINGATICEKLVIIKVADRMICVTMGKQENNDFADIIECFYALN